MTGRVLIAGVGNIFLGDDGFGVEVARRLAFTEMPDGVRVADYGTSGMHLAYDIADGYETTILVDAAPRGGPPGTLTVLEVGPEDRPDLGVGGPLQGSQMFNAHGMQPDVVFGVLEMLGAKAGRIVVVGCQPASLEEGIGLSEPVAAAVDGAIRVVTKLAADNADGAPCQPAADNAGDVPHPPAAGPETARSGPRAPAARQEP
jgi:hydrogenase maturation protease